MANANRDAKGWKVAPVINGQRRTIRLSPKLNERQAASAADHIGALVAAFHSGTSTDPRTVSWLADVGDALHERLAALGLCQPRMRARAVPLGEMLTAMFAGLDVKPASKVRMEQARTALVDHFTDSRDVATITEADAEEWRAGLKELGYSAATISRTVLYARQMFRWGIRRGMAGVNPFAGLKAGAQTNHARAVFVSRDTIAKVIDAAPDAEWKLLITLSRFGGMRVPSEALALTWQDVDWEHNRITIRSCKTEHHEGGGSRIIPMFPEIREHLLAVYDAAPERSTFIVTRYREGCNLNPQLHRIVKRAGLKAWPRLWHNLRASRQTELAATFPLHTVCAWIGNSRAIAAAHYLQTTDADWERAVGGDAPKSAQPAKPGRGEVAHPVAQNGAEQPGTDRKSADSDSPDEAQNEPRFPGDSDAFRPVPESECQSISGQSRT